nr:ATPase, AAA-type, core, P-loop containing nucleoside triphosphate hydrolase [Tanacetum cinerariifolium]
MTIKATDFTHKLRTTIGPSTHITRRIKHRRLRPLRGPRVGARNKFLRLLTKDDSISTPHISMTGAFRLDHKFNKDYILEEDKEAICNLIASQTPGSVWANLKNIVAESRCSARWRGGDHVTMDDVCRAVRRFNTHGCYEADEPVTQEPMRLIVGSQN